mmetsp:Transcript_3561/g.4708  ORF Transcript_3561/g.4708 Transcript_3561/m.4708 type:complete len:207 (-) Transcript_3561:83-703(-)
MPPQQKVSKELLYSIGNGKHDNIEVGRCAVKEVGLEKFIRSIVKEIDLHLQKDVVFNLNERGILYNWDNVFEIERVYSQCLGISNRLYQCRGYTHEEKQRVAYFILEEYNERIYSFLPDFKFFVVVFCYYDSNRGVTKVDVQYDQMSFFLHCLGVIQLHRWVSGNVLTPFAIRWMRVYKATRLVHPITFLAQITLAIWLLYRLFAL